MKLTTSIAVALATLTIPVAALAHFNLVEPVPSLKQDERGDPQKLGPCGGTTAFPGEPSGVVTPVKGGQNLHIKINETIFHPGHFRIALARTADKLPADPETETRDTDKGPYSVSAKIDGAPKPPVIADGLFVHTEKPATPNVFETDIKIPNVNCADCTLQVIQWMGNHGYNKDGGYTYHHCAALKITADPKMPADKLWATGLGPAAKK